MMNESTIKSGEDRGLLMSPAVLAVLLTMLAFEATVLLLGGLIDGRWKGFVWMAIFGVAWVVDLFIGRWISRRPDVAAARSRYSLMALTLLLAFHAVEQILAWAGAEIP
jgi:hypothetical protein